jgi:hypothetical protein
MEHIFRGHNRNGTSRASDSSLTIATPFSREQEMKLKTLYLGLCIVGFVLPYWQFVPWVVANGLHLPLFFQQLFSNRIGGFFGMDVFVSSLVLVIFMRAESARLKLRGRWLPVLAVLTVGVSLALPLFLYLRELMLEQDQQKMKTATA